MAGSVGIGDAHVQVVVMVGKRPDDPRRASQPDLGPHQHRARARGDQQVDEVLRERTIDLAWAGGRAPPAVATGVIDVGVQISAPWSAEVSDQHRQGTRIAIPVAVRDAQEQPDQGVGGEPPPTTIR